MAVIFGSISPFFLLLTLLCVLFLNASGFIHMWKPMQRLLNSQDDDWESVLVDRRGDAFEPYSLAWRYLGIYMDCDDDEDDAEEEEEEGESGDRSRRLSGSGDDRNCARKILWAAYRDPRYKGGSIGEYQFFNWRNMTWDKSTCKTRRCARMDCHEPRSHWKLVGVYKETDGLTDWAEQLFKHEGVCVWGEQDEDAYEFMQTYRQKWVSECYQLSLADYDGNTVYLETKPLAEGNMTYGLYTDEDCSEESEMTFFDYIEMFYQYYYYYSDDGSNQIETWNTTFNSWNEYMTDWKVCQPCRAYSRSTSGYDVDGNSGSGDRRTQRNLDGEENDGEGEAEQWGFNCQDDAGYQNCNQCYKFEIHTDMEEATLSDLKKASPYILRIRVKGRVFGSGGFDTRSHSLASFLGATIGWLFAAAVISVGAYYARKKYRNRRAAIAPADLKESLAGNNKDDKSPDHDRGHSDNKSKEPMNDDDTFYTSTPSLASDPQPTAKFTVVNGNTPNEAWEVASTKSGDPPDQEVSLTNGVLT